MLTHLQAQTINLYRSRRLHLCWAICIWLSFLFSPVLLYTQSIQKDLVSNDWLINVRGWGIEEGFPATKDMSFTHIFQDSRGILWFTHTNQLVCFDGNNFKVFDAPKIKGAKIVAIQEDENSKLWLLTNSQDKYQLGIFDLRREQLYSLEQYIGQDNDAVKEINKTNSIFYFNKTKKGLFIINNREGKIWRYHQKTLRLYLHDKQKLDGTIKYHPGPGNLSWRIENYTIVNLINKQGVILKQFHTPSFYNSNHFFDEEHRIWHLKYPTQENSSFSSPNNIAYELLDTTDTGLPSEIKETHLWGGHHPFVLDKKSGIQIFPSEPEVPLYQDGIIFPDLEKSLNSIGIQIPEFFKGVTASKTGGFWIPDGDVLWHVSITKNHFSTLAEGKSIRSVINLKSDSTLLTLGYQFAPFVLSHSNAVFPFYLPPNVLLPTNAYYNQDYLWFGNEKGINRLHLPSQELVVFPVKDGSQGSFGPEPRSFHFLSDSTLLFCSDRGVFRYFLKQQKLEQIVANTKGNWIYKDQKGQVWIGTGAGLHHFESGKTYLQAIDDQNFSVKHIHETSNGYFWVSTDRGLIHWKPFSDDFERITTKYGLLTNNIHACYPDKRGFLWLSTNYGISVLDPKQKRVQNFLKSDGLAGNEQNYLAHHQSKDGRLYIGGIDGITSFYPDQIPIRKEHNLYNLILGPIKIFSTQGRLIKTHFTDENKSDIVIPSNCNQLSVPVMVPSSDKYPRVLQWRISGIFPNWSTIQGTQIDINGLRPGKHTLEIRAYSINSPANPTNWNFPISKKVIFYKTSWFFLLCIGLTGFTARMFFHYRARVLRQQKKQLEATVEERTAELENQNVIIEAQNQILKDINKSQNQLFKNISHEFRTPLSLISLYSEELLKDPTQGKAAKSIKEHTTELKEMIDEILSLQKIDSGILPLHKSPKDWMAFLRHQFGLFVGLAQKKQLLYLQEFPAESRLILNFDEKKVTRIVQNLIGNAIKYTPEKGRVTVRCVLEEQDILFSVQDNGPGIPKEEQQAIFRRYYQGSTAGDQTQPGYGIGLALCREYAALMDAELWVESELGKGSTFYFQFPKEEVASTDFEADHSTTLVKNIAPAAASTFTSPPGFDQKKANLLIVEDNEELLDFLKGQFSQQYSVTAVTNGQLALNFLKENPVDLIISDLIMPVMDGQELLKIVRQEEELDFIPFIILTAIEDQNTRIEAFQLGVDAFITKPFDMQELQTRTNSLVHHQQVRQSFKTKQDNKATLHTNHKGDDQKAYDQEWVDELIKVIVKEIHRPDLKIVDLAYQMHVSERTFRNKVVQYTGMSPSKYLTQVRIDYAIKLFNQRKHETVGEVAYACGFKNVRYFSQVFKRVVGKTPSEYQEKFCS